MIMAFTDRRAFSSSAGPKNNALLFSPPSKRACYNFKRINGVLDRRMRANP
jgi:hypothetical protein